MTRTNTNRWKSRALWALAVGAGAGATETVAGDVIGGVTTVNVSGGTVTITGDDGHNGVRIYPSGNTVYLQAFTGTITGATQYDPSAVRQLVIRMNGGDDRVEFLMNSATISGGIGADLGDGNDQFTLSGAVVRGDVLVSGGRDYDYFTTIFSVVSGDVKAAGCENSLLSGSSVSGALGLDARLFSTTFAGAVVRECSVTGKTTLRAGGDGLGVTSSQNVYQGKLKFVGGEISDQFLSFADTFGHGLELDGGGGDDFLQVANPDTRGPAEVVGGSGDDEISVGSDVRMSRGLQEPQPLTIRGNGGNDSIQVGDLVQKGNYSHGELDVNSGGGQDQVRVFNATVRKATLKTGGDRDALYLFGFSVSGQMRADGGADPDTLYGLDGMSNSFGKPPTAVGFETEFDFEPL